MIPTNLIYLEKFDINQNHNNDKFTIITIKIIALKMNNNPQNVMTIHLIYHERFSINQNDNKHVIYNQMIKILNIMINVNGGYPCVC